MIPVAENTENTEVWESQAVQMVDILCSHCIHIQREVGLDC